MDSFDVNQAPGEKRQFAWIFAAVGVVAAAFGIQFLVSMIGTVILMFTEGFPQIMHMAGSGSYAERNALMQEIQDMILEKGMTITAAATFATLVVFVIWYRACVKRQRRVDYKKVLSIPTILMLLVLGIGLQFLVTPVVSILLPLFPKIEAQYSELMELIVDGNVFVSVFTTVVMAPIAEEMIFRGIALHYSRKAMPFFAANLFQAFLFGLYHMNIVQFCYAFAMGLVLGYIVKKHKTIWASVILHAAVNASSYLVGAIPEFDGAILLVLGVGILFTTVILLIIKMRPDADYKEDEANYGYQAGSGINQ